MPAVAPQTSTSLGDIYSKTVQLVNENKISSKNAFDLNLIDHIDDIVASFMGGRKRKEATGSGAAGSGGAAARKSGAGRKSIAEEEQEQEEHRFHEASCTIEASARIYACRVDVVHEGTYRVLGGLSSNNMDDEDGIGEDGKAGDKKRRRICGVNTLERNEASIIQSNIESDEQSDPSFRRMAAAFDAGGAKGLLLSHLPIAEDLSLVFNGDVPLTRAQGDAISIFSTPQQLRVGALGLGQPEAACEKLARARLCPPQVDAFRKQLWGNESSATKVTLARPLEALLGAMGSDAGALASGAPDLSIPSFGAPSLDPLVDMNAEGGDCDLPAAEDFDVGGEVPFDPASSDVAPTSLPAGRANSSLPLMDVEAPRPGVGTTDANGKDDGDAFDELFQKFWAGGDSHQFGYFDECWAKNKTGKANQGVLADAQQDVDANGVIVQQDVDANGVPVPAHKRAQKRPLFDLSGLDKPARPIETEPVHKHQLSERNAHWQLHRDVPPYMIDRITMPSWPTWSKCDFACLGLRPHLMLKLVRKPQPPEREGQHSFSELFSTVVVENPEAFPWLATDAQAGANAAGRYNGDDDGGAAAGDMDFGDDGGDDDFNGNGLPAHLDVDPNELFLRADDNVVPGCDQEGGDFGDMGGPGGEDGDDGLAGLDFDLADRPDTVGKVDIGYSRNSKFVDVKLVKKHLLDCINEDMADAKAYSKTDKVAISFQELVRRTVRRMPKAEMENLSVAVCFICALHLCNEKGLELAPDKGKPLGDFAMVGLPA